MQTSGILLVNTGTPNAPTPEAIRPYLKRFLSDKRIVALPWPVWQPILRCFILPRRPLKTVEAYRHIWTAEGSPYTLFSRSLERKLKRHVAVTTTAHAGQAAEPPLIRMAHRYGEPSMAEALDLFCNHGVDTLTVLPLYPQQAFATTESVRDELRRQLDKLAYHPQVNFIDNYHDHPLYLAALSASISAYLPADANPTTTRLLFSFHSTPQKDLRAGDCYHSQTQTTARQVAAMAKLPDGLWQVAYQSRFEDSQKWIGPFLPESIDTLLAAGIRNFYILAPGFAVDNIETLHEIEHISAERLRKRGNAQGIGTDSLSFTYIPALNDSEQQIRLLANLVGF